MYFAFMVASCSATPNAFTKVLCCSCLQAGFSSVTKGVVPWGLNLMFSFFNEGIHCFPDLLAAWKARRFQVADNLGVPDSHSSHTRYQSVKIKTNSMSQLSDDLPSLSLRQTVCVSVSKSAPPLDFQVRRSKYCRCTSSTTALTCTPTFVRQWGGATFRTDAGFLQHRQSIHHRTKFWVSCLINSFLQTIHHWVHLRIHACAEAISSAIQKSSNIHTILLRSRTRMFVGRPPTHHHTSSCHVLLTETFNWIVRKQTYVLSQALENNRSTRIWPLRPSNYHCWVTATRASLPQNSVTLLEEAKTKLASWSVNLITFHRHRSTQLGDKQQSILLLWQRKKQNSVGFLGQEWAWVNDFVARAFPLVLCTFAKEILCRSFSRRCKCCHQ